MEFLYILNIILLVAIIILIVLFIIAKLVESSSNTIPYIPVDRAIIYKLQGRLFLFTSVGKTDNGLGW